MANYAYMTVCTEGELPSPPRAVTEEGGDWRPYPPQRDNPPWYEAKYSIPLFWLCLFETKHLHEASIPEESDEGESRLYRAPVLLAPHAEAVANVTRRRPLMEKVLPPRELGLYDEFARRVREEFAPFILVIAYEVAFMDDEGEYAKEIIEALCIMDALPPDRWTGNGRFANVTGLDAEAAIGNPGWYTLVGYDNHSDWPDEPEDEAPAPEGESVVPDEQGPSSARPGEDAPEPLALLREAGLSAVTPPSYHKGSLTHSPFGRISFALLPLTVVLPVVAGWFYSWWCLLLIPVAFMGHLMITVRLDRKKFAIDFINRELRYRDTALPFAEIASEQFSITQTGDRSSLLFSHPQHGFITVIAFAGQDAETRARDFLRLLLSLITG